MFVCDEILTNIRLFRDMKSEMMDNYLLTNDKSLLEDAMKLSAQEELALIYLARSKEISK